MPCGALQEAELEYVEAHRSTAVFAAFPLPATQMAQPAKDAGSLREISRAAWCDLTCVVSGAGLAQFAGLSALIWTTTPWTIPANKGPFRLVPVFAVSLPDPHRALRVVLPQPCVSTRRWSIRCCASERQVCAVALISLQRPCCRLSGSGSRENC